MNSLAMTDFQALEGVASRVGVAARFLDDFQPCGPELAADEGFPAASVIKVGIMSCLLQAVSAGEMALADPVEVKREQMVGGAGVLFELEPRDYSLAELCRLMMVISDNTASNALARHFGLERLNSFWAARSYDASMRRFFMDPVVEGRDNRMTPLSAAMMLRDLYRGVELDDGCRDFAIGCLRRQQYREKIPLMLPEDQVVGHKTGELDGVRHDAAVVEVARPYILAVLTAEGGSPWLVDREIGAFSLALYQGLNHSAQ